MLSNLSIKRILQLSGAVITAIVIINMLIVFSMSKTIHERYSEKEFEVLPHTFNFLRLQKNVIQVQQWLTDISATRAYEGFDDGFEEAKVYYNDANEVLAHLIKEHKKYKEQDMVDDLNEFKNDFESYYKIGIKMANAYIKGGPEQGNVVMGELDPFAEKLSESLSVWIDEHNQDNKKLSLDLENAISTLETVVIIFGVLLILLITVIFMMMSKRINTSLINFENGLLSFFDFVNRKKSDVKLLDENNNDEISKMAKVVNQNILRTKKVIDEDNQLIQNTTEVVNKVIAGRYKDLITAKTSNKSLEELKENVNNMISSSRENFVKINEILNEYVKYDYRNKLDLAHIEKDTQIDILIKDINHLRNSIVNMLKEEKDNGETLNNSANLLFTNVQTLSSSTEQAATSIEETAASLEEITENIKANSLNVTKMADFAKELTKSSNEGKDLASKTTISMQDINTHVSSINEAIEVIDQIAFQTNILSLNAAVEAATAGEAGKGFAVVAQEVRNLANKSAEAANEIKRLVEEATLKSKDGKEVSERMINGYEKLNDIISETTELIKSVDVSSYEQEKGIIQVNDALSQLDKQTQNNAYIATQTKDIAIETKGISEKIVRNTQDKNF